MKKSFIGWVFIVQLTKTNLKMKLTTLLLMVSLFNLHANFTYSQNAKLTLDLENVTIEQVFDQIESISEFRFLFESKEIDIDRKVSLNVEKKKIKHVLDLLFKNTDVKYRILNRQVLLTKHKHKPIKVADVIPDLKMVTNEIDVQLSISGTVADNNGTPLPGASVIEKGTTNGTQTDFDGNFSLNVTDENAILVISYIGFATQEIMVGNQQDIQVVLTESTDILEEVVVVGYGTQAKKDVTGSYSSIAPEALENRPIVSAEQALQGVTPGIQVFQANASPGQLSQIFVRGVTNLSTGSNPLFVIDGFATEDQRIFQAINPTDIAKIDILKDASASAIYGSRGSNGVIIVTTKSGRTGETNINVSLRTGINVIPGYSRPELLNAEEYVQYYTEAFANRGIADVPDYISNWNGTTDTDWVDEILRTGIFQDYSISASGGTERANYLVSGGYLKQEGAILGESFEKFTARLKTSFKPIENIEIGITLAPNYTIEKRSSVLTGDGGGSNAVPNGNLWTYASFMPPTVPVRRADGTFTDANDFGNTANPLEVVENFNWQTDRFRLVSNAYASVEFMEGLTFRTTLGATYGSDVFEQFARPSGLQRGNLANYQYDEDRTTIIDWLNENTLTYKKVIGDHSFDVLGGYTAQKTSIEGSDVEGRGFSVDGPTVLGFTDQERENARNSKTQQSLVSILGRFNYSYKDKYLVSGTFRRDGSSRFGSNNRYANFLAGALAWRISEESFLKDVDFINDAKIRLSYGESGNNLIPNAAWRANLRPSDVVIGSTFESAVVNDFGSPGNPNLTWETSEQINFGLDLTLFDNKVGFTFDYYDIETSGLLLSRPVLPSTGFPDYLQNIGAMEAKGLEMTVNATPIETEEFSLNVGGNISYNDNEVTNLGGNDRLQNFWGVFEHQVGEEIDQIRAPELIGVDGSGEPIWNDVSGDGNISNFLGDDAVNQGSPTVHWIYGFNVAAKYKDWELSTLWQGQAGGFVQDFYITQIATGIPNQRGVNRNISREAHFDGRYINASNPGNGRIPQAGWMGIPGSPASVSSYGVQKTDYLRIRNVTLRYDLPQVLKHVKNANLYLSVENLYTFTNFIGGNPDARRNQGGPGGRAARLSLDGRDTDPLQFGLITTANAPLPTIWTIGLNFSL